MHFALLDRVLERTDDRIVTVKLVTSAEEYLQDHFAEFPVLPGVFMVESLVHAARELVGHRAPGVRLVLGGVRAVKYGRFVRPGEALVVTVELLKHDTATGTFEFKGSAGVRAADGQIIDGATAVSGKFTLRPVRLG
jgi:3-hydroxyacyl-[acyl-carrier-protein] dehydratase